MDALFSQIEIWNNNQKWGSVLDAGSGAHSLSWLLSLDTDSVTALTGDPQTRARLTKQFSTRLRESDVIVCGNWLNQSLFDGQAFDTIIIDYLIGSMTKYSPYFQSQIFQRIRNQSKTKLYLIGQEPLHDPNDSDRQLIKKLFELRDACILLSGHTCYQEYPQLWCQNELTKAGFTVTRQRSFPIKVDKAYVQRQIDVCKNKLPYMSTKELRSAMHREVNRMTELLLSELNHKTFLSGLNDYVIEAVL